MDLLNHLLRIQFIHTCGRAGVTAEIQQMLKDLAGNFSEPEIWIRILRGVQEELATCLFK